MLEEQKGIVVPIELDIEKLERAKKLLEEIKGLAQEVKELFQNFQLKEEIITPVAGTTDVNVKASNISLS